MAVAISLAIGLVPSVNAQSNPNTVTIHQGENASMLLSACPVSGSLASGGGLAHVNASASGPAASWVSPKSLDFGNLAYGACSNQQYVIGVPSGATPGDYSLHWAFTCTDLAGHSCSVFAAADYLISVVKAVSTTTTTSTPTTSVASTSTTSLSSTTSASGVTIDNRLIIYSLGGDPSLVQVCAAGFNNCQQAQAGVVLQPGQCLRTLSVAAASGITGGLATLTTPDGKMIIQFGPNGEFCAPVDPASITTLFNDALTWYHSFGGIGISEDYSAGANVHVITPFAAVTPLGTQFAVLTTEKGTTVMVVAGSAIVTDLKTNSSVRLLTGQSIVVANSTAGTTQAQMLQNVSMFDTGARDQWWSPLLSTNTSATLTSSSAGTGSPLGLPPDLGTMAIALAAVFAIIVLGLVISAARARRSRPGSKGRTPPQAQGATVCPSCGAEVGSQTYCENCGAKLR